MRIAIVGTGYVGLVTGVSLAHFGHDVVCVDTDPKRVEMLCAGRSPIYEPGIEEMMARNSERLTYTDDYSDICHDKLVFVCVGTPGGGDGHADLRYLMDALKSIHASRHVKPTTAVIKSTVPVGTNARMTEYLDSLGKHEIRLVSCPEFLKEGDAIRDFQRPDRVVIGSRDHCDELVQLFRPFVRTEDQIILTDPESAEMTKYASNAMLATRISFMNELSRLAEATGANIDEVRRGMGADSRIGSAFLYAGIGFGGSCFPKDVRALMATARHHDQYLAVVEGAIEANEEQREWFLCKILDNLRGDGPVAIWGAAFKPETDDVRESPGVWLAGELSKHVSVRLHDPRALDNVEIPLGVSLSDSAYAAAREAEALVLATEWPEYRRPDFPHLLSIMDGKLFFDGRNAWPADAIRGLGGTYFGVGRP